MGFLGKLNDGKGLSSSYLNYMFEDTIYEAKLAMGLEHACQEHGALLKWLEHPLITLGKLQRVEGLGDSILRRWMHLIGLIRKR